MTNETANAGLVFAGQSHAHFIISISLWAPTSKKSDGQEKKERNNIKC